MKNSFLFCAILSARNQVYRNDFLINPSQKCFLQRDDDASLTTIPNSVGNLLLGFSATQFRGIFLNQISTGKGEPSLQAIADQRYYDIPIKLNKRVQQMLRYYTERKHSILNCGLARSGRYMDMFLQRTARAWGLPQDLVFVVAVESNFNERSVSVKQAVGLWQFMSTTAQQYQLRVDPWIDQRRDPLKSDTLLRTSNIFTEFSVIGSSFWQPITLAKEEFSGQWNGPSREKNQLTSGRYLYLEKRGATFQQSWPPQSSIKT